MKSQDVYTAIANKIIADLENNTLTWSQPWTSGIATRPLRSEGKPYTGINIMLLWCEAMQVGYSNPTWITYKQAQKLGGQVRKGSKGTTIVYADRFVKTETDSSGNEYEKSIPYMKTYSVFNVEQIDNLPEKFYLPITVGNPDSRLSAVEAYFASTNADIRHQGDKAYYSPSQDYINMPQFESFKNAESYYAVLGHECIHWTGHKDRLDRQGGKKFGDEAYAFEELVAELGSAFLCADLGITPEVRADHTAYIKSWLKVLKSDHKAIFSASSLASKATDYLHNITKGE